MILCVFLNYHIICVFSAAQIRFPAKHGDNRLGGSVVRVWRTFLEPSKGNYSHHLLC